MSRRLLSIAMLILLGCGAKVLIEEEDVLAQGEGGFLGTGEQDMQSAIEEACDLYSQRLPNCPHERCIQQGEELLTVGEKSGCDAEAVSLFYCVVQGADEYVCLFHHRCNPEWEVYEDCWRSACNDSNDGCGL